MGTASNNGNPVATGYFYKSLAGVLIDKTVSLLFGFAALILGSTVFPIVSILFRQYYPLDSFLKTYAEFCTGIVIITVVTWGYTLWKRPSLAWGLHGILSATALVISGMMRLEMGLPRVVWIQFLLHFAGIIIICEMLLTAFAQATWKAVRVLREK